jgi:hypothetical protein
MIYAIDEIARSYWRDCLSPAAIAGTLATRFAGDTASVCTRSTITTRVCIARWPAAASRAVLP